MALRAPRPPRQPRPTPRQAQPRSRRRRRSSSSASDVAKVLAALGALLWPMVTARQTGSATYPGPSDASGTPTVTVPPQAVPVEALASPVEQVVARPLPGTPEPGQKRDNCEPPHEEELVPGRGCWYRLQAGPPCKPEHVEHHGGCYVPVYLGRRTPVGDGGR